MQIEANESERPLYQIAVSGASKGKSVKLGAGAAFLLGQELARLGNAVFTGATHGLPYEAAKGARSQNGQSIGFSPATSQHEHVKKYRLPTDAFDVIIYTGLNYVGRDLLLVQSADAVISIGGRVGTWHEFTVAFETNTPLAVFDCFGGVSAQFQNMLKAAGRNRKDIIYEQDATKLVKKLDALLDKQHATHGHLQQPHRRR